MRARPLVSFDCGANERRHRARRRHERQCHERQCHGDHVMDHHVMDTSAQRRNVPVRDRLHPLVWAALVGFVVWFVIALWGFGMEGYADWLLFVVSAFAFIAVMIPVILSRIVRTSGNSAA